MAEKGTEMRGGAEAFRQALLAAGPRVSAAADILIRIDRAFSMRTSMTHSKKERGASASKRVEAYLRKAIHVGKLRPRQRIIEEDLARELEVSRGPVREALLRLERDGLVVTTSRRGTFIRDISLREISVIFRMRAKLEGLCVRYIRENPAIDAADLLDAPMKKLAAAAAKNSDELFFRADMELHRTIWEAADQPLLYRTLNLLMSPYIVIIAGVYSSRFPMASRLDNHEEYVRIILETPLNKVEKGVERYFNGLHKHLFGKSGHFPPFGENHWTDHLEERS